MLLPPPSPMALSVCVGDPQSAQVPGAAITRRRARGACKGGAHGIRALGALPPQLAAHRALCLIGDCNAAIRPVAWESAL